jgi:cytochrome bd-type quinol oxidase subunit 2
LNPASVTISSNGNGATVLTVKTTAGLSNAHVRPFRDNLWGLGGEGVVLAGLLIFVGPSRRRRWMSMLVLVWVIVVTGAIGCNSIIRGSSSSAKDYTFLVAATDSTNSKITASANFTVTVQ